MAELKAVFNQCEITEKGTVQVRIAKQVVLEKDRVVSQEWHRVAFEPGVDVDLQFALVNKHLEEMGYGSLSQVDVGRVKSFISVAHTPELIEAARVAQEAGLAKRAEANAALEAELLNVEAIEREVNGEAE